MNIKEMILFINYSMLVHNIKCRCDEIKDNCDYSELEILNNFITKITTLINSEIESFDTNLANKLLEEIPELYAMSDNHEEVRNLIQTQLCEKYIKQYIISEGEKKSKIIGFEMLI